MPTVSQFFWPDRTYVSHDQVYGTDIDAMVLSAPSASSGSTVAAFGGSGAKSIIFDPATTNSTNDITNLDQYGFTINNADMGSTSTAKRRIIAGTWTIAGEAKSSAVALANVTLFFKVYKVAASPSFARTEIFSTSINMGLLTTAQTIYNISIPSITEQIFEAGETMQLSAYCTATGQVGNLSITLTIGAGSAVTNPKDFALGLPAGIATRYIEETRSVAGSNGVLLGPKKVFKSFSVAGTPSVVQTKKLTLARAFTVAGSGAVALAKKSLKAFTVAGSGSARLRLDISEEELDRIVGGGGSGTTLIMVNE